MHAVSAATCELEKIQAVIDKQLQSYFLSRLKDGGIDLNEATMA